MTTGAIPMTTLPEVEVTATPLTDGAGLVLRVDGTDYAGWLAIRVRRNVEAVAADFACEVSERWPGREQPWAIPPGAACTVLLDGEVVVTGYVDVYAPAYDARTHRVEVRGRSKTGDLVDSAAVIESGQLKGLTVAQIADRVAALFGITVDHQDTAPAGAALPDVQLQQGESAYALLERLSRVQGILVSDDAQGRLVLARAGRDRAAGALVQGENILAAQAELDFSPRHSVVIVKGQRPNLDDAADWTGENGDGDGGLERWARARAAAGGADAGAGAAGDTGVSPSGRAEDPAVTRYRPLIVQAETQVDAAQARQRAEYEVRRRIGQALRARVTVQGWRQTPGGPLWDTNLLVPITSAWLGLDQELLISAVEFQADDGGTRTELELTPADAYLPTAEDAAQAAQPASGQDRDTKANFWTLAGQSVPAVGEEE